MSRRALVTGSRGYMGRPLVAMLLKAGWEVNEYDLVVQPSTADLSQYNVIFHLAGHINARESFLQPDEYYESNVALSMRLIAECRRLSADNAQAATGPHFVFASSATAAEPASSPYAMTKAFVETFLPPNACALRLFNVAGAVTIDGKLYGESHEPETHLIPRLNRAALTGSDFDAYLDSPEDRGPIRDYVHLRDVLAAFMAVATDWTQGFYEVGTGHGKSLWDVVSLLLTKPPIRCMGRTQPPEPASLVSQKQRWPEGWRPTASLLEIVEDDYEYQSSLKQAWTALETEAKAE